MGLSDHGTGWLIGYNNNQNKVLIKTNLFKGGKWSEIVLSANANA